MPMDFPTNDKVEIGLALCELGVFLAYVAYLVFAIFIS